MSVETGKLIQAAREYRNMSRTELGKKIGKPYQRIREWETGINIPKYSTVKEIADALLIQVEYFYQDSESLNNIKYYSEIDENGEFGGTDVITKENIEYIEDVSSELGLTPRAFLNKIIDEYRNNH